MTREDFLTKWRYELAGIVFEASALVNGIEFKIKRAELLRRIETVLRDMYDDLTVPPGSIPSKLLADIRQVFATIKELTPEKPKGEAPKGAK